MWLEAEGARLVGGDHRQHNCSSDCLIVGKLDQLALAARLEEKALGRRQRALKALAGQLALGWPVVAQRHDELVRPETPIMRIWSVDMRSDAGVELVDQPSDRTARRPLPVRTAVAGRDLDRQDGEAALRLGRQRRRRNRIRTLDGADAGAAGERQHQGPGHGAIRRKFVLKARQLLQREFQRGKLVHVAVHGRDNVDEPQCGEGSALPVIVNTRRATTIAVARFGPPPATAAQAPRHCGGTGCGKAGCSG